MMALRMKQNYCSKDGLVVQWGEVPNEAGNPAGGKMEDRIVGIHKQLKEGKKLHQLAEEDPYAFVKNANGLMRLDAIV